MACPIDISILLADTFKSKPEDLARVIFFLSKRQAEGNAIPYIQSLQSVVCAPAVFKKIAERMVQDTMTEVNDRIFRQVMKDVWNNFLKSDLPVDPAGPKGWPFSLPDTTGSASVECYFIRNLDGLPSESLDALRHVIYLIGFEAGDTDANKLFLGELVEYKSCEFKGSEAWGWTERPKMKHTVNSVLLASVAVLSGVGGRVIFSGLGIPYGSIGFMIGVLVVAIRGGGFLLYGPQSPRANLTDILFNLPESEELENAYNVLGLSPNASDSDVSSRFRRLALQHHPDKNGCSEKWLKIRNAIAIIRANKFSRK